jgi:hypothetical protein
MREWMSVTMDNDSRTMPLNDACVSFVIKTAMNVIRFHANRRYIVYASLKSLLLVSTSIASDIFQVHMVTCHNAVRKIMRIYFAIEVCLIIHGALSVYLYWSIPSMLDIPLDTVCKEYI